MDLVDVFQERLNIIIGAIAGIATVFLGPLWWLYLAFLGANIVDCITGTWKARELKIESSAKGAVGIRKKVGYWVVIAIAFFISNGFIEAGSVIGVDLSFLSFLGWFTLFTYIVNEIRSIVENLVAVGVNIPKFLVKGLEVADKAISDRVNIGKDE